MFENVAAFVDLQHFACKRGGNGMGGVGVSVPEGSEFFALFEHGVIHIVVNGDRADGEIRRGQSLRHGDGIRREFKRVGTEPLAQPSEPAHDLVGDEPDIVFVQHGADFVEVGFRRDDDPARRHDRLGDKPGDSLVIFALDGFLEFLGESRCEVGFAFSVVPAPVGIGTGDMDEAFQRQVEVFVQHVQTGEAGGCEGDAVIAALARNNLLFVGEPPRVVVIPEKFDLLIVCFGAGTAKEDFGCRMRRDGFESFGEFDGRLEAFAAEEVRIGKLLELLFCGLDEFGVAVSERTAPQARKPFDVFAPLRVEDVNAFAAFNDKGPAGSQRIEIGVWMDEGFDIAGFDVGKRGIHNCAPVVYGVLMFNIVAESLGGEQDNDIESLLDLAFGPGRFARSAYRLREGREAVAGLSFVCFGDGGDLLGSIRYWGIRIGGVDALLLGPLAVHPEHQGEGIGLGLMQRSLEEADKMNRSGVLLVGDAPYYRRVGFEIVPPGRITFPGPVDAQRVLWRGNDAPLGRVWF